MKKDIRFQMNNFQMNKPVSRPVAAALLLVFLLTVFAVGVPQKAVTQSTPLKVGGNNTSLVSATWTGVTGLPSSAGDYRLDADVTISSRWDVPAGTVNLDLNGHSITRTDASGTTGSVINVGSGAVLNLYDCGTQTRYYTVADPAVNGAGLGTVVDESTYNAASENARGTFTGGYITGGVAINGGGVCVDGGSFILYGGTIIGNEASGNDTRGGGVRIMGSNGSFTMEGGAILANKCSFYGGGIGLGRNSNGGYPNEKSTMIIHGGTIRHNWSGKNGGAIHVIGNNSLITAVITGGSIIDNYTVRQSAGSEWGGALIATFISPKISGAPVIKGNICQETPNDLCVTKGLNFIDHLSSGADVGVSLREPNKLSSSDIQVGINAIKDDIQYLHYSGSNEAILVYCDGSKDWAFIDNEFVEMTGTNHTHEAGTVWASAVKPVASVANSGNAVCYNDFSSALNAWTAGSTLKLYQDVTTTSTVTVPSGEHTLDLGGHGIKMAGNGSVINVADGAKLSVNDSNKDIEHRFTVSNAKSNGAGLASVDDTLTSGYQIFNGGYITGGNATNGGGIIVQNGGYLTLNGGTIIGNQSGFMGAGIKVNYSGDNTAVRVIMAGGTVMYNKVTGYGGGVCSDGAFEMTGGTISHNYATNYPAGIHCHYLYLSGGNIVDNYADGTDFTAGAHADAQVFLSGAPVISGNISNGTAGNLDWDRPDNIKNTKITITGALTEDAKVCVTLRVGGTGVFTSGWKDKMGEADPSQYFISDNDSYSVFLSDSGEAEISEPVLFEGSGTEENPYLIQSATDWDTLSEIINSGSTKYSGKHFKLTDDISVTTMLGNRPDSSTDSNDNVFSGTFDGDGHTITCNIDTTGFAAPFAVACDSTIKNLTVAGVIRSSGNHAAGVVSASKGVVGTETCDITIKNVTVTADISCNSHVAGIVGHAHNANIIMENVVFDGSINASSVQGGFIGWGGTKYNTGYTSSYKDCVFTGTYNTNAAFYPVAFANGQGTATLVNDFYTVSLGSGGSPVPTTGDGQVRLLAVTVEKDGNVRYFADIAAAADTSNWVEGSILRLRADVTSNSTVNVPTGTHTLDLNGYTLKAGSTGYSVITVANGAILSVDDSADGTGKITGGSVGQNYGGGVTVDGGRLTLMGGAISGNANTYGGIGNCGGGIHVRNGGEFYMEGGEISYNTSYVGGDIGTDDSANTVSITGGVIKNNTTERFASAADEKDGSVKTVYELQKSHRKKL